MELYEKDFNLHYWKGGYTKVWEPWMLINKTTKRKDIPWTDKLPKSCVILCKFLLVDGKLTNAHKKHLRERYSSELDTT